jgi:hypothetical protein
MKRHSTDLVALLFGLAFITIAVGFAAVDLTDSDIAPAWFAAIALLALGAVALVATLAGSPGSEHDDEMQSAPEPGPQPES